MISDGQQKSKDLLIRINDQYKRVRLDEIYYLQSEGKYVTVHIDNRNFSIRTSLKKIEKILSYNFVRTHSSFIVNIDKVNSIRNRDNTIVLTNDVELSFSRTYKEDVLQHFHLG